MSEGRILLELKPNKLLLDPYFEGYKLSLEGVPLFSKSIPTGVFTVRPASDQFSFLHIKLFTLHNHLHVNKRKPERAYYFDKLGKVHMISFSTLDRNISVEEVYHVPDISDGVNNNNNFNASLAFPAEDLAVVSTGNGALLVARVTEANGKEHWELLTSEKALSEGKPCILLDAQTEASDSCRLLHVITLEILEKTLQNNDGRKGDCRFQTILKFRTFSETDTHFWKEKCFRKLSVDGSVDYAALESGCKSLYVVCDKHPEWISDSENPLQKEPTDDDELVKKKNEKLYYWSQRDEEIFVKFPFSETLVKSDIAIDLQELSLEIKVKKRVLIAGSFFHRIDKTTSFWCFDKNNLDFELTKFEKGLMWKTLFTNDDDASGQEIIDPDVVENIHERLSHLCSDGGEKVLPPFNSQQLEECDVPASDSASLLRLDALTHRITHEVCLSNCQWLFKIDCDRGRQQPPAMCCRHDVDACVWQFKPYEETDNSWPYEHLGTFFAFGYVQASKTQKKFLASPPDLSYAVICEASHHVYIYWQPAMLSTELKNRSTGKKIKTISKQKLINLETNEQILGVHATNSHLFILLENSVKIMAVNE